MATLAELELRIKSEEAVKAEKNLKKLAKAAKEAAKEAAAIEKKAREPLEKFDKATRKAAESTKKLKNEFEKKNKATQKLSNSYKQMTSRLQGLVAGIGALLILRQAVTVFAEFEQTMAEVGGVTKATGEDFAALTKQARELGAVTRFSARQAADAQLALSRAGFTVNETLETSAAVLNLASAAQLELGRSAEITAITMRQFQLSATDAVKITDILVNTANSATTNVEGLAQALKFTGSIASGFGKDLEETAAAIGVVADAGLDASQAGTGLRGVFARLGDPIGKAAKTLDVLANRLGKTRKIFDITENSLADIFQAFKDAGASTQDFIRIFGRLQAPAALALVSGVEKIRELTEANKEAAGETKILADRINDTLKGSLLALKSAAEEAALSIGDSALGGAFRGLIDLLRDTTLAISGFNDGTTEISLLARGLAVIFKVLAASLGIYGARLVLIKLETFAAIAATRGLTVSLRAMRGALLSTGIGVAVVLFGELVAFLSDSNDAIDDIAEGFGELEESQKKSTIATKEQIAALDELNRKRLEGTAILQKTLNRFNDATVKLDKLFAGATEQSLKDLQTNQDLLRLNTEAAKQRFGVTKLTLKQQEQVVLGTIQIINIEKNLANVLEQQAKARDAAAKAAKDRLAAEEKLQTFLNKRSIAVEESGLAKVVVQTEKLQEKFQELFLASKGLKETFDLSEVDFDTLLMGLDRVVEQQNAIAKNKALKKLGEDAKKAGETLAAAFRTSRQELDKFALSASDRNIIETQREFASQIQDTIDLLEAQDASPEQLIAGLVTVNSLVSDIARNRGLLTLIEDGKQAEQSMNELAASIQASVGPLVEFEQLAEKSIDGYRAQLDAGIISQDQFNQKLVETNEAIAGFAQNLNNIETIEKLGAVADGLVVSFQSFFDTIITGSQTAGEAALELFREISRLATSKLAIDPLIAALKAGISGALGALPGSGSLSGLGSLPGPESLSGLDSLPVIDSAKGNAFNNGNIQAFARGGIIGGPTLFPLGLAGEKGPEAILPLKRDSSGNLGVAQVDSRPQRRATLSRPFVNASVSTGASEAPSRQELSRGGSRIINQQINVRTLDVNAFRQSSSQIQADAFRAARGNKF